MSTNSARQFEDLLLELQETVAQLETDQLTLEDAIAAYERAVALANECARLLDDAELRITTIDAESRSLREESVLYRVESRSAAALLLGDDEEDLADLLDDE